MIKSLTDGFVFPAAAPVACKSAKAAVTKSVDAQVQPVEDGVNPNGEFVLIATDFNPDEWMPLPAKVHLDTDAAAEQGLSVPNTAGSGTPEVTDNGDLIIRGTWASTPHAQMTRQLVNEGHVWAASLLYFTRADGRRELLNGTFAGVPDPGAPRAFVATSKAKTTATVPTVQQLHDLAAALGATCQHCTSTSKSRKTPRRKAMHRDSNRADMLARAKLRRLALLQDVNVAVAEAESLSRH